MNIREIAKMANVSAATVSKVLNGKTESISKDTQQRILKIVKELNYIPATAHRAKTSSALLLGVLISGEHEHEGLLTGMIKASRDEGYSTIVCDGNTPEAERKSLAALISHQVSGIVWKRHVKSLPETHEMLKKENIPFISIDENAPVGNENLYFDYVSLGERATNEALGCGHTQIRCVISGGRARSTRFYEGYQHAMYLSGAPSLPCMRLESEEEMMLPELSSCSAVVCENHSLAYRVYRAAKHANLRVPGDLSIVCLTEEGDMATGSRKMSALPLHYDLLGAAAIRRMVSQVEDKPEQPLPELVGELNTRETLAAPGGEHRQKIVVVGTLNMDTIITLRDKLEPGQTMLAQSRSALPGGKALNQAVGCKKLGAEAVVIGKIGKDYDGSMLYQYLQSNGVNTGGVAVDTEAATGSAFINIQGDGESSIVVCRGANENLVEADIENNRQLFQDAGFCLLQTELPASLALRAARIAHENEAKVILKPCSKEPLDEELLRLTDYLIPNRHELDFLCPDAGTMSEKAQRLLDSGAKCVIVTLGHKGCLLKCPDYEQYFPALDVKPVDTTGASDAFAAALAVYLLRGKDLQTAISYANCAGGLSTMRYGVPAAMVDHYTVELYARRMLGADNE